jgi:SNF2 family DNA or RNA helicase
MENFQGRLIGPYQRDGVKWMVQRENTDPIRGGFLCDEMGLGKTVQTIATILIRGGSTLIVAPRSVVAQWKSEIKKFAPILKVQVWDRSDDLKNDVDVVITSYAMIVPRKVDGQRPETTPLHNKRWQRIILDEGHEIRNRTTQQFKSAVKLRAVSRWILSGTPVFNSMKDFVTLCQFLGAEKIDVQRRYDWYRDNLVLRRTKESVCEFNERLRLPPCDFQNVELEMYPEERDLYRQVYEESQDVVMDMMKNTQLNQQMMYIMECMLRCRQVLIWPQMYYDGMAKKNESGDPEVWTGRSKKMETLLSMIDKHPNESSLVFCQFMGEMDYLQEQLNNRDIVVHRIDGRSTKEERENIIESFRKDSKYWSPVLLIQIKAGGVGLNLQEASRVYITSPAWNPATELQAIGRAHRTGQTKKVVIRKLIYSGDENLPSIEESIMELQGHKAVVCGEVLNDQTFAAKLPKVVKSRMTVRELRRIFAR